MYPDAPLIKRQGEVDAWDNPEFRKAIEDTGKKQVIMAGKRRIEVICRLNLQSARQLPTKLANARQEMENFIVVGLASRGIDQKLKVASRC
jgi:nicotinamidase-related amidase